MRASDRTTRGFCLCDYPVYALENICHAFHSCVPRCMSVWLCLRTGRWLCGFAKSDWILLSWCLSVRLHLVFVCVTSPALCGILVRVRIWLCGFAYPTTLRGEVNFPENHACGEPVTVVTPIVEVCIRIGDLFTYTRWWELLLSLRAFSCVCGNLLCVHLSHRLYIYILVFCGDPFLSFAGSSHPDVGLGRGDDGGWSGPQWTRVGAIV